VRRTAVAVTILGALIVAALAAGAWEIRRLDQSVQALRADVEDEQGTAARSLVALSKQTAKVRESDLRQEFYLRTDVEELKFVDAYLADRYSSCAAAKRAWEDFVNNDVIPSLNRPDKRAVKIAVRRDDPDYHATLLETSVLASHPKPQRSFGSRKPEN
jgi:hypothetical protein